MKKILFLIVIMLISIEMSGQILYNIEKPFSYKKSNLELIRDLPNINFSVLNDGSLNESNINTGVKDYVLVEKSGNKNIARVKVSADARNLGEISVKFSDVILNNGAYCYVYTNDYKVVAGPIYQNTINENLNIVKIPAKELILEVIYTEDSDYELNLSSVFYKPAFDSNSKNKNQLQETASTFCANCYYGDIDFDDTFNNTCDGFGSYGNNVLFNFGLLSSINDFQLEASRAACIIIGAEGNAIVGKPGTLMNFPYDTCESSFIFTVHHIGMIQNIIFATEDVNENPQNQSSQLLLDNTIIRFNWHHKYGTPWNLENIDCSASDDNFKIWRQTINFDEVIDYCGVKAFAYSDKDYFDIAILKMQQTPFYKEQHLGWTTQNVFENTGLRAKYPEDFAIMGRKANKPTMLLGNHYVHTDGARPVSAIQLNVWQSEDPTELSSAAGWEGWSGSQILYRDYDNPEQMLGLGLHQRFLDNYKEIKGYVYGKLFEEDLDTNLKYIFLDKPNHLASDVCIYDYYLKNYTNMFNQDTGYYWMPSVDNREKCPSDFVDTCDFGIDDYFRTLELDGALEVHINLNTLSPTDFPGNAYPQGLRIYHTKGDQETFYFDSFSGGEMNKNISFTIDKCDMFYYQSIGLPYIELGFDFYDATGKVLNDCQQTIRITYEPVSLCDYLVVKTDRISDSTDTCCTYTVNIDFEPCDNYSNIIYEMINSLQVKNQTTGLIEPLQAQTDLTADYLAGNITFTISNVCDSTVFELIASSWADSCSSKKFALDCVMPAPPCDSCKGITPKIRYWWGIELVDDGSTTGGLEQPTRLVREYQYAVGFIYFDSTDACPGNSFDSISVNVQCYNNLDTTFSATDIIPYGTNEGYVRFDIELPPVGDSCYYVFTTITPLGPCVDSILVHHSDIAPPLRITQGENPIKLNTNSNTILQTDIKEEYDALYIINEEGKIYKESKPVSQIDTRGLATGRYYLIFKNKNEIIHSREIIIQE